ncbi:response regulator [Ancylomarina euxinus]|uniref:Response regulator n=1 Tax=Ancylomarina euxinus TaxID=2283627 RepID=A0A425XWE5_9BACT|nr:response regulator [Ancylomarina euxinus]MCZ4696455.1 response regulator [Ancylomarina euxinus]MUP16818.1 response regulator [Ancylomarina euxinus]RRG18964.1 response regulator [Ancylomarina euxinus]
MANQVKSFAESAKGFTKSPLGIIALFIVLVYGFATLAVSFGNNLTDHITPLIYFLVIFPVIVFIGFLWLVSKHHDKIYGPSDFKNEDNFLKMKMSAVASLAAATANQPDGNNNNESTQQQLNSIVELVSKTQPHKANESGRKWRNKVLWVDDRPENNIYERKAFESQGIEFSLALSTNEAIEILKNNKYAAIISDMGRKEGLQEGYVLLEKIRKSGLQTPFFIYAGSNAPEHKMKALERGAQGSTNRAQELFEMVMNRMSNE